MFCPNCGNDCQNANFCSNCGQNLRSAIIEKSAPPETELHGSEMPVEEKYPNPPVGRYYNHDHDYIELSPDAVTIFKKSLLGKPTTRKIQYTQVRTISLVEAEKLKSGGFLSIQDRTGNSRVKATVNEAANDELSIVFSWKQNDSFLTVYHFLKSYADRASKNHKAEKWPSAAKQMIDDAREAREYENTSGYVPAQTLASSPETFDIDALGWYPGKKKHDRRMKIAELEKSGQVYCPKCLSTSISANQKGFGYVRGALGANLGLDVGMIAGGIGSKKVICTCLKCGYQWTPGKK